MARKLQIDLYLMGPIVVLTVFGVAMVYSASAELATQQFGSSFHFAIRQAAWSVLGLGTMWKLANFDYRRLGSPRILFPALAGEVALLSAVFLMPIRHNTHRWIYGGPLSFQPSELAKILLIIFFAYFLDQRRNSVNSFRHTLLPGCMVLGMIVALILKEPDLGTSLAIVMITAAMFFVAGLQWRYFVGAALGAAPLLGFLIGHSTYQKNRLIGFLHPESDPLGKGFQMLQSLIAVGSGGITGIGLGEGRQKLFFLPDPQTDFIYAVISEEWGIIGAVFVLVLFAMILCRGMRAAIHAPDGFGKLLGVGFTVLLVAQALVNVSVVIGLLPTKGIPLPFVSYGGSSLVMNLAAAGILLNISQHASGSGVI